MTPPPGSHDFPDYFDPQAHVDANLYTLVRLTGYTEAELEHTSLDFCLRILRAGAALRTRAGDLAQAEGLTPCPIRTYSSC